MDSASYSYQPLGSRSSASSNKSQKPLLLSLIAFFASLVIVYTIFFSGGSKPITHKAVVLLRGDGPVSGKVYFEQVSKNAPVQITGHLKGLDPNALRGFHIHEAGDVTDGCASTGGHYNPHGKVHGAPSDAERHVGDLGNVQSDANGEVELAFEDATISLNGPGSIVGRAVVLHSGTDDLGRGGNEDSLKTGNAGGRVACGVIGFVKV